MWWKKPTFFKVALRDFIHAGTVFPSSHWATKTVSSKLPSRSAAIVEYGGGDGRLTRRLLKALPADGHLVTIELNEHFLSALNLISDPRLKVVAGNVVSLSATLRELANGPVDAIVSGIPFSFLTPLDRRVVTQNTFNALRPGGRFIVYQNSPLMRRPMKGVFGHVSTGFEPRNLPPYFVMVSERRG